MSLEEFIFLTCNETSVKLICRNNDVSNASYKVDNLLGDMVMDNRGHSRLDVVSNIRFHKVDSWNRPIIRNYQSGEILK